VTLGKIKYKNQLTIPSAITKILGLKQNDVVSFSIKKGQIVIVPVQVEPRYTPDEIKAIDEIVAQEKNKAKIYRPGDDFQKAIDKL
jgi:bifunctional DNA-binding transcriptional regulator/antitoxin component of YhaV-PrlF toxin-antitoxin module